MRIVMLPSWYPTDEVPYAGGFHRSIARAVAAEGHDVTVLFPELRSLRQWRPGAGSGELDERMDGAVREMRWRGFRWWPRERHGTVAFTAAARRLFYEYVSRYGAPDVLHAHIVLPAGHAAGVISGAWDVPFVLTEQAGPFSMMTETVWQRRQVRRAMRRAAAITTVSRAERAAMRAAGVERTIEVIPNPVDGAFLETPPLERPRTGETTFLCIASMVPGKGHVELVRAFAKVAAVRRDVRLVLGGDGPLRGQVEGMAGERIEFLGALRGPGAVREALDRAQVFVLPSHAETFGVVLIEALARGLPVISTRCGGPESIVNERNGILADVGDVEGLAAAMLRMADEWRRYDAAAIRADCEARFGPRAVARQFGAILERVAREHRERSGGAAG